jgi:hypothetical protein
LAIVDFVITGIVYSIVFGAVFIPIADHYILLESNYVALHAKEQHIPFAELQRLARVDLLAWLAIKFRIVGTAFGDATYDVGNISGIITTYMTSIWLWLVVIGAPISRFVLWSSRHGVTFLGRLFDTQRRPFTALGFVVFVLFLIAGGVATVVSAV